MPVQDEFDASITEDVPEIVFVAVDVCPVNSIFQVTVSGKVAVNENVGKRPKSAFAKLVPNVPHVKLLLADILVGAFAGSPSALFFLHEAKETMRSDSVAILNIFMFLIFY